MPAASIVDSSHRVVITVCSGELTLDEIKATSAEIQGHSEFHPDFQQLIDLSAASKCHLYAKDLYQLKDAYDPFSNKGKRAVVAPDAVWFGIGRMYQLMLNSTQFAVFRSLPEAIAWLGLDVTVLEVVHRLSMESAESPRKESTPLDATLDVPALHRTSRQAPTKGRNG
jgi:hypothetical protein